MNDVAITDLVSRVKNRQVTVVELVQQALDAIAANEQYHAVLETNPKALDQARTLDELIAKGQADGPLLGIPYIVKDNFLTVRTHTTAASKILEPFEAPYESTTTRKLNEAGAILVGKANLDSFGHGSSTENSDFGPTRNPHNPDKVPGGSSGGSAAAVALGVVPFALGTDTGGSLRLPASFCGVVGYKPSYGLVSRYGVVAMASSTDCIGVVANSTANAGLVLDVISGHDPRDGTSVERDPASYLPTDTSLNGKRFGLVKQFMDAGLSAEVREAIETAVSAIKKAGGVIEDVDLPSLDLALACYYIIVPAEISSNLARYDGVRYGLSDDQATDLKQLYENSRSAGFNSENKRRIMIGTFVTSSGYHDAYYLKAQTVRSKLINDVSKVFASQDYLIGPVSATTAFDLGAKQADPLAMYLTDIMTVAANLVGVPSLSLPVTNSGMPVGLQIMAAQGQDRELLTTANELEKIV